MSSSPVPVSVTAHQKAAELEIQFDDGLSFRIPFELMRVYSPSAEVRGHGVGQEVLQYGKRGVTITQIEPIGHYAIKPTFSDGHASGLFSWDYLYFLGSRQDELWKTYEARLQAAGLGRDPAPDLTV
ncbi:MAG: gamma-butyrobetaine hydroxylase-like domain-containing protein [Burkholderiales bacterium]